MHHNMLIGKKCTSYVKAVRKVKKKILPPFLPKSNLYNIAFSTVEAYSRRIRWFLKTQIKIKFRVVVTKAESKQSMQWSPQLQKGTNFLFLFPKLK